MATKPADAAHRKADPHHAAQAHGREWLTSPLLPLVHPPHSTGEIALGEDNGHERPNRPPLSLLVSMRFVAVILAAWLPPWSAIGEYSDHPVILVLPAAWYTTQAFSKVDLPQPLGPTITENFPCGIAKSSASHTDFPS